MTPLDPGRRPRIAVDLSPLASGGSLARWMEPALAALEHQGGLEWVPIGGRSSDGRRVHLLRGAERRRVADCDGFHTFTSGFPLRLPRHLPLVQTIHEVPWRHGVREGSSARRRAWAALGRRRAAHVLCPTAHVRQDLLALRADASGPPITAIPWGIDPRFFARPETDPPDRPTLLLPLADRPKKRALAALHALERLPTEVRLALTGVGDRRPAALFEQARALGLSARVDWLGRVPSADLPALFARSAAVLCLAASEGFCLPVAEALASRTPPVHPAHGAQVEVAGAHGIACADPLDPAALAASIEQALAWTGADPGQRFARRYTWSAWAERTLDVWRTALLSA